MRVRHLTGTFIQALAAHVAVFRVGVAQLTVTILGMARYMVAVGMPLMFFVLMNMAAPAASSMRMVMFMIFMAMFMTVIMTAPAAISMRMVMLMLFMTMFVTMFMTAPAAISMRMVMFMLLMVMFTTVIMATPAAISMRMLCMFFLLLLCASASSPLPLLHHNLRLQIRCDLLNLRKQRVRIFRRQAQLLCGKSDRRFLHAGKRRRFPLNFSGTVGTAQVL